MSKEVLSPIEKQVLKESIERWKLMKKAVITFTDLDEIVAGLKKVNGGIDRVPSTIWSHLKRMAEPDTFVFGARKGLTDKERVCLETFVEARRDTKKAITVNDAKALVDEIAKVANEKKRHSITIWRFLQKAAPDLVVIRSRKKEAGQQKEEIATVATAVSTLAALKVLEDMRTIAHVMGKPADYLAPLDEMLAKEINQKDVSALEKKITCLEKKLVVMAKQFGACKKALRITCRIRQEAITLTKVMEEIKNQDGIDIPALIAEEE